MKVYIKSYNEFTDKATKLVSRAFTDKYIAKKSEGSRKGESMQQIYLNIVNDPNVTYGEPDKLGRQAILYNGEKIGWIDFGKQDGFIDNKAYEKIAKYVEPEEDEYYEDEEDYDYGDDDIDACDNI